MPKTLNLIVAAAQNRGIGASGTIPWRIASDMAYFRDLTTRYSEDTGRMVDCRADGVNGTGTGRRNAVIMGRKTWDSIPKRFRPLPDRFNVVLSSRATQLSTESTSPLTSLAFALNLDSALSLCDTLSDIDSIFIIGGAALYAESLARPECTRVFYTFVDLAPHCDAFFPVMGDEWKEAPKETVEEVTGGQYDGNAAEEKGVSFRFALYQRVNERDKKEIR